MYAAKRESISGPRSFTSFHQGVRTPRHEFGITQVRESIYLIAHQESENCKLGKIFAPLSARFLSFDSIGAYLEHGRTDEASCLIVDMESDEQHGEDLPSRLGGQTCPPVILLSEHADISAIVRAIKSGVLEFLLKPVDPSTLRDAVATALTVDEKRSLRRAELTRLEQCYSLLTPRERQVLPLVVGGLLNKQAASLLGISEVTLQIHRSQIMRKMQATCFADLIRMALKLHIPHARIDSLMPQVGLVKELGGDVPSSIHAGLSQGAHRRIAAVTA